MDNTIGDDITEGIPLDLANFVLEVDRFSCLCRPVIYIYSRSHEIFQWKNPKVSAFILLLCNFAGLFLCQATVFFVTMTFVLCVSGLCMFHIHTRILDKLLPETHFDCDEYHQSHGANPDPMYNVTEFRVRLVRVYSLLLKVNKRLSKFFAVLKWDEFKSSLRFYCQLAMLVIFTTSLPARWNFVIVSNYLLLSSRKVEKYVHYKFMALKQWKSGVINQGKPDESEENVVSVEDDDDDLFSSKENKITENRINNISDIEFDSESDSELPIGQEANQSKPGVLTRLAAFKKSKEQYITNKCHECGTSFTSILKRRNYCRHCGNHFCSKCCSHRVRRALLGATSPASQVETVVVCTSCHNRLVAKEIKLL